MTIETDLEELRIEYEEIQERAARFCKSLKEQIEVLLFQASVELGAPIEFRVKTWQSIKGAIEGGKFSLEKIRDLDDLVGLRLIFLFDRDVDRACEILEQEFDILKKKDKASLLNEDQFGYQSNHYLIKLPEEWSGPPSMREFDDLKAEIQVRTFAQHIWAATSHKLQYKQEKHVPPPVRRSIHRVAALLEIVDLEFERVLQEREDNRKQLAKERIWEEMFRSEEPLDLDVDVLDLTLEVLLPETNRSKHEDFSELLLGLEKAGVTNDFDLIELIDEYMLEALEEDRIRVAKLIELLPAERTTPSYEPIDELENRLWKGAYFTHTGLVREMLRLRQKKL